MRGHFVSPSLFSRLVGGRWEKRVGVMRGPRRRLGLFDLSFQEGQIQRNLSFQEGQIALPTQNLPASGA